ncbi:MAG: VWA domain-containing protein [Myxococcales bacterium]|nr:VWA domain-containing protein [Myxococcales bacterium]
MTLGAAHFLWLLVGVVIVFFAGVWSWRAKIVASARFGTAADSARLQSGNPTRWRIVKAILLLTALTLAVVALARPQYGGHSLLLKKRGIDIVVALDFSKSMLARDVSPSRIERAKAEVVQFVEELGGDRVGIVAFAGDTIQFPMTTDYPAIRLFLRDLNPYDMPLGGTAIGRALTVAQQMLGQAQDATPKELRSDQVVVLVTDGEDHEGEPSEAAEGLAKAGIKLFVVGIGSSSPARVPTYAEDGTLKGYLTDDSGDVVMTALDARGERELRGLARTTGGSYFRAAKGSAGIEHIRHQIHRMKQTERHNRQVIQREDRYVFVLLPAFALLVLEGLLPEAWLRSRRRRRSFRNMVNLS